MCPQISGEHFVSGTSQELTDQVINRKPISQEAQIAIDAILLEQLEYQKIPSSRRKQISLKNTP